MVSQLISSRRGIFWLLLFLTLGAELVGCTDQQRVGPKQTPTASPPTPEAGTQSPRIPYPWPMKQQPLEFSSGVVWLPGDARVYQEMEADFLTYWTWSGQAGP